MPQSEVQVPARYYIRLIEMLAAEGMDVSAVLQELNLSEQAIRQTDATLPFSRVDRLLQWLVDQGIRGDIAYDLGKTITASAHSFVGFGMLNSATVDQALRFEARYFRLVMPSFAMRYRSGADAGEIHVTPRVAMSPVCLNFHMEAIGTAALREVADLTGGHRPPCQLDHSIAEPVHAERYRREVRNVQVNFAMGTTPGVRLRILENLRTLKLDLADAHALQAAEDRCRALVQRAASRGHFADWVAMTLREVADELPSLDELAGNLSMSKRSLNRYLAREGTSFRELAGRIQHEIACERLTTGQMTPGEVAFSLGFSDQSNFSKAFRARAGCSPGEYRRGHAPA